MSASQKMKDALIQYVVPELTQNGFTGKYPHFRKEYPDRIELLSFQPNKYGNSFLVEISVLYTGYQGFAANFCSNSPEVSFSDANVQSTNVRFRLNGMHQQQWFYYSDLYCQKVGKCTFYNTVGEKAALTYIPQKNERLIQKADENIYRKVCDEVIKQLEDAYHWWNKMRKHSYFAFWRKLRFLKKR